MNLKKAIKGKFSIMLMVATVLALPSIASAQGKIIHYSQRGGSSQIWSINPDGSNPTNLSNNDFEDFIPDASATGDKIAFASTRDGGEPEIYVMNGDGSNQTRLTDNPAWDFQPTISGDGSKIAFVSGRDGNWEIYVVNSDGTNLTRLTNNTTADSSPSFSEDGTKILFIATRDDDTEIYVMNADGSDQTRLTFTPGLEEFPEFNAAGNKIVFQGIRAHSNDIFVMDADGSNEVNLTNSEVEQELYPSFSPDGSKIAFNTTRDNDWEIYTINADGTNLVNVSNLPVFADLFPSWTSLGGPIGPPTDKDQCKNGGWKIFNFPRAFVNQGDCIDFVKNGEVSAVEPETDAATSASQHTCCVNVALGDGSVRFISQSVDVNVGVWRIYLPDSPLEYDFVDARDPDAESKARALFDAADRLRSAIVVTVRKDALDALNRVQTAGFLINDGGDANVLEFELENCQISSWQTGGGGGALESYTLNFTKINTKYRL